MNTKTIIKGFAGAAMKHLPTILRVSSTGGYLASTIMAVRARPKADMHILDAQIKKGAPLTKTETVQACWKDYAPAGVVFAASTAAGFGADHMLHTRNTALGAALAMTETAAREYSERVIERIGEKEASAISDSIAIDHMHRDKPEDETKVEPINYFQPSEGRRILCYYVRHGRWFRASIDELRRIQNDFNEKLLGEMGLSENELLRMMSLDEDRTGDDFGWDATHGQMKFRFVYQTPDGVSYVDESGEPAIGVDFEPGYGPRLGYDNPYNI